MQLAGKHQHYCDNMMKTISSYAKIPNWSQYEFNPLSLIHGGDLAIIGNAIEILANWAFLQNKDSC